MSSILNRFLVKNILKTKKSFLVIPSLSKFNLSINEDYQKEPIKFESKAVHFLNHFECRSVNESLPKSYAINLKSHKIIYRSYVPDDKVSWSEDWPEYNPVSYTATKLLGEKKPSWADVENPLDIKNWNKIDGEIDRRTYLGEYQVINGVPRNPIGRTGLTGRGILGRWGPNHAADPIVTRWKMDEDDRKIINLTTNKPILQFVSIKRVDTNTWAIPGGMRDVGEKITQTLKREFMEEALNVKEDLESKLNILFNDGIEVYHGYVDDPRNTDNAWMETAVYNFHDKSGTLFKNISLTPGDDAGSAKWQDIDGSLNLYANHKQFIHKVAEMHNSHW